MNEYHLTAVAPSGEVYVYVVIAKSGYEACLTLMNMINVVVWMVVEHGGAHA